MEEVENQGSNNQEETQVEELASPQTEIQQETAPAQEPEEKNWVNRLRKDRDEAIRRERELERKAQMQEELLQKLLSQQQQAQVAPEEDILQEIQQEEYVPGEKVVKGFKKLKKDFDKELAEIKKEYAMRQQESQLASLRQQWSDLDDVVNPETLRIVAQQNPQLASAWQKLGDDYSIALVAYPYLKSQIDSKSPREVDKKIAQNSKSVQSPQTFNKRPMAQAFQEPRTREEKEKLWNETLQYARQAGSGF